MKKTANKEVWESGKHIIRRENPSRSERIRNDEMEPLLEPVKPIDIGAESLGGRGYDDALFRKILEKHSEGAKLTEKEKTAAKRHILTGMNRGIVPPEKELVFLDGISHPDEMLHFLEKAEKATREKVDGNCPMTNYRADLERAQRWMKKLGER